MAGGRGERFWPMSTSEKPKQLLALTGKHSMLEEAVNRLEPLIPPERIMIVTSSSLVPHIQKLMPKFPANNLIGEPEGRNTAPAIALGSAIIRTRNRDAQIVVLTADHIIGDTSIFLQTLKDSLAVAAENDALLTLGIPPTFPCTGFGYLEAGSQLSGLIAEAQAFKTTFLPTLRFVEKPDAATAADYLNAGNYYWNSGMFIWSLATFEKAARKHHPELFHFMAELEPSIGTALFSETLKKTYAELQKISIDYAIMEKADNILMAKAEFSWDDLGSWSSLQKYFQPDQTGNISLGNAVMVDAKANLTVSDSEHLITLIGVENLIVVQHGKALLVCPKERDQDVKKIIDKIKQEPDGGKWL